jgi:hypothetical protein
MEEDSMKKLLIATAAICTALPFTFDGVTPTVSKAQAVIGRPLTPGSIAGVHRRAMRRTYGVGANLGYHPVARAAVAGAAVAGAAAAGAGYYGAGYGGWGWGGWGGGYSGLYSYAGAAPGMGGNGYGTGLGGCTTTFDEMTGYNWLFCPGTGYVSGGPVTTPAYASGYGSPAYGASPAYASGYGTGYGYPAYGAYRTAYHPVVRRHIYASAAGVRRYGQ